MKNLVLIGGGLLAYYIFKSKRQAENLNYYFKSFSLSFDGITPVLKINIVIQNINNSSLKIKAIEGDLLNNSTVIGKVYNFDPVTINPASQTDYSFNIRLLVLPVVSDIISKILQGDGLQYNLSVIGNINAESFIFPFKFNFNV